MMFSEMIVCVINMFAAEISRQVINAVKESNKSMLEAQEETFSAKNRKRYLMETVDKHC